MDPDLVPPLPVRRHPAGSEGTDLAVMGATIRIGDHVLEQVKEQDIREKYPRDFKEATRHTDKALTTSGPQAKSLCPHCGTDVDLSIESDLRAISSTYPVRRGEDDPNVNLKKSWRFFDDNGGKQALMGQTTGQIHLKTNKEVASVPKRSGELALAA